MDSLADLVNEPSGLGLYDLFSWHYYVPPMDAAAVTEFLNIKQILRYIIFAGTNASEPFIASHIHCHHSLWHCTVSLRPGTFIIAESFFDLRECQGVWFVGVWFMGAHPCVWLVQDI